MFYGVDTPVIDKFQFIRARVAKRAVLGSAENNVSVSVVGVQFNCDDNAQAVPVVSMLDLTVVCRTNE